VASRDEYCPVYRSLDLVGDRWSLLIVREIVRGVTRFNELERSLPGISRSTLSQRLRHLEREGVVERHAEDDGHGVAYAVTEAGGELMRVVLALSDWGVRWFIPKARPSEIDPDGLMVWISRHVVLHALPSRRVVVRFDLHGRTRRLFWLVLRTGDASLCPEHPGFDEDVFVEARPADLYGVFVGRTSLEHALSEGLVRIDGPTSIVRALPRWFVLRKAGPPLETVRSTVR